MTERKKKKPPARKDAVSAVTAETLAPEEIRRPTRDVGTYIQWAGALLSAARDHQATLLATPMVPEADITAAEIDGFEHTLTRLTDIEDEQDRRQHATAHLTPAERKNYAAARAAQKTATDAIRHAFRNDRVVRGWCAQVLRGEGIADLHDDARKLTSFWEEQRTVLAPLTAGKTALDQMSTLAAQLPTLATPDVEADRRHTRLRNAAWTLVDRTAVRLCEAGRFALWADRDERKRFRGIPRKARRKASKKS